jgi:hypothetical protein
LQNGRRIKVMAQINERLYDRLSNIFVLVAIGSALFFDSAGPWHVAVGTAGIAAGISAVVLYLRNQSCSSEKPKTTQVDKDQDISAAQPLGFGDNWLLGIGTEWGKHMTHAYSVESNPLRFYLQHHYMVQRERYRHQLWYLEEDRGQACQQEVPLSPNDVAACAIEIIRDLSSGDDFDRWQFSFGPGGLRVSARNEQDRSATHQRDLDFGQASTLVN